MTDYAPLDINYAVKAQWIRVADWWKVRQAITSARADAAVSAAGAGLLASDAQGQPPN